MELAMRAGGIKLNKKITYEDISIYCFNYFDFTYVEHIPFI